MAAFEYRALNAKGREVGGTLEADTPKMARQQLRERGLAPLSVNTVSESGGQRKLSFGLRRGMSATDLALVTRQLATLLGAALPLEEALDAVARQSESPQVTRVMKTVRAKVREGHSLAQGLAAFPGAFPELYRATVAAGEESGHLELVLERLADYTERRQEMRQKVTLALFYPTLLTIVALAIVAGLLTYVVPQVVAVFQNTGQELPGLTQGMIAVSDFARASGVWVLAGIALTVILFRLGMRRPGFRETVHRFYLRLPLIGRLIRGMNTARFARTFSILSASGVAVLDAMRIGAEVMANLPMRQAVETAATKVREGAGIGQALGDSDQFPPMTLQLIASGESSGRLEKMLDRAAAHQERELETVISAVLGLFEPVLILIMGGVVLMIVVAVLLPIFELNQLVGA